MPEPGPDLVEKAELAVASCRGVLPEARLEPLARLARIARVRATYAEDMVVVALLGGTGSGKSSLLNAVVGDEVVPTGGIRPTTDRAVALVPTTRPGVMDGYLAELGVAEVIPGDLPDWVCLVDTPDMDSVEEEHRLSVTALLPLTDMAVWVLDPEKYRDDSVHGQLRALVPYQDQMVFCLNQADRLDSGSLRKVLDDLNTALSEDGFDQPSVVVTSADPPAGPPQGVDRLLSLLGEMATAGAAAHKTLTDLDSVAGSLAADLGRGGLDFEERAARGLARAEEAVAAGAETTAVESICEFLEDLAADLGEPLASELAALSTTVPVHVRRAMEDGASLAVSLVTPARAVVARRARAQAALADLSLTLASPGLHGDQRAHPRPVGV